MYKLFSEKRPDGRWIFDAQELIQSKATNELISLLKQKERAQINLPLLDRGDTLLHYAARYSDATTVQILLEHRGNANIPNHERVLPIHCAKNAEIMALLIPKTNNLNSRHGVSGLGELIPNRGMTPLQFATIRGDIESVKLLLDAGADVDFQSIESKTALDYIEGSIFNEPYTQIAEILKNASQSKRCSI